MEKRGRKSSHSLIQDRVKQVAGVASDSCVCSLATLSIDGLTKFALRAALRVELTFQRF